MMPAPTWAFDLQGVRALAHRLYCSCQEPSSIYRPLARSVRTLRNKLEEADEALNEASVRPEDIAVLQASGESRDVLNRLERALKRRRNVSSGTEDPEDDNAADLLNDIDDVTRKLSTALEVLEHSNGNIGLLLNATNQDNASTLAPRSPSLLTSSSDDGNKMSTASSSLSFNSRPPSFSKRMSVTSEPTYAHRPEAEKQVVASRTDSGRRSSSVNDRQQSPPAGLDRLTTQFAYFDPMSVDIDSASSLIMGRQLSPPGENPSDLSPYSPPPPSYASPAAMSPAKKVLAPSAAATRLKQYVLARDSTGSVGRASSLRSAVPSTQAGRTTVLSSSTSLHFSARTPTFGRSVRDARLEDAHSGLGLSNIQADTVPEFEVLDHDTVEAPLHHIAELAQNENLHADDSPTTSSARPPLRVMSRSAQAMKSRYRVVNPEKSNSLASPPSSPISRRGARRWASAESTPHVPETGCSPGLSSAYTGINHDAAAEEKVDEVFTSAIVSSWNAGLWDQAKHNIELLLGQRLGHRDSMVTRKLQHLLGVLASLNGEPEQALIHFVSVLSAPIEEAFQLDIGHCAAAYWMGDIYAFLNRRTEALLAYSIASRNPLLQDSRWLPLHQQILAEKDACRSGGTKTGINIDWDDTQDIPGSAGSILDPSIIARDVARMVIQAGIQPISFSRKLDPKRSRAMAFHDLGLQSGSWQDKHTLHLDATAFEPSAAWPSPFDPLFVLENVRQHRLLGPEIDLLQIGLSATKIPKKSRVNFSCQDLRWLIVTLRRCLTTLEMAWSEVIVEQSPKFIARYTVNEGGISKSHLFSVPIYRLSYRPGYGLDICPDGIGSTRIKSIEPKSDKGVHCDELKRVKKVIREFMETAAKRQEAMETRSMALPVMSINGVTSLHRK